MTMNRATINPASGSTGRTTACWPVERAGGAGLREVAAGHLRAGEMPKAIKWNSFSPRVGITYAVDESRRTQLRGSYARFASQLGNGASAVLGGCSTATSRSTAATSTATRSRIQRARHVVGRRTGPGSTSPTRATSPSVNKTGDYNVPKTHELIFGVDHELFKNFGVSGSFTWRKFVDFTWNRRIGVTGATMYTQSGTLTAARCRTARTPVPYYKDSDPAKTPAEGAHGGRIYDTPRRTTPSGSGASRSTRDQAALRPLDGQLRVLDQRPPGGLQRPRDTSIVDPTPAPASPQIDGGLVVRASGGSGKSGHLPTAAEVPAHRQRPLPGAMGDRLRREPRVPPGLRPGVVPEQRGHGRLFGSSKTIALYKDINQNRLPGGDLVRHPRRPSSSRSSGPR